MLGGLICLGLLLVTPAHAGLLCTVFKYCLYEGVPFTIKVVDKETGSPLPNVHALAEWLQQGRFGAGGPVMVQDAVSGPDGVLTFPAWGPLRGSPDGLLVYEAPVITLCGGCGPSARSALPGIRNPVSSSGISSARSSKWKERGDELRPTRDGNPGPGRSFGVKIEFSSRDRQQLRNRNPG